MLTFGTDKLSANQRNILKFCTNELDF